MIDFFHDNIHKISRSIKPYLYSNLSNTFWCSIEEKTKFKRENIISYTIVVILVIDLAFGWAQESLCNLIGFVYPLYASLAVIEASAISNNIEWNIYWIISIFLRFIESFVRKLAYSVPFYSLIKCIFLIWLMTPGQKGGTYIIYHRVIRWLLLQGRLFTMSESSFKINPCSENVVFDGKCGKKGKTIHIQSNQQGIISLNSYEDDDYTFNAFALSTEPLLLLHQFRIKKLNRVIDTHTIDLQGTILHATFKRQNEAFAEAEVSGKFIDCEKRSWSLKGKTNHFGVFTIVLPEGIIYDFMATNRQYIVQKIGSVPIPAPIPTPLDVPRPPKYITIETDSLSFSHAVNPTNVSAQIIILGDVSGSMKQETRMSILKRSYLEIFERAQKNGWKVSLASWDDSIQWCTEKWIQSRDIEVVKNWIDSRTPDGENDMKNAINDSMNRFPDATDVYVMCDGDIDPFTLDTGDNSWSKCRNQYQNTKFHFIALGTDASCGLMEAMATIGGGTFTHAM